MTETSIGFEQTELPILAACDAVVVGGSFGGIAAALQLASVGLHVTLVEPRTYLGREISATLRPWLDAPANPPPLISSVLQAAGKGSALNMDALKIHLEDRLLQAGVKLLYASACTGVQLGAGGLQGIVIGRALARCGSVDGYILLASYLNDSRALLAEHAHKELAAITGADYGKDVRAWSKWIEENGDRVTSTPWKQATEPVQAWAEAILRD